MSNKPFEAEPETHHVDAQLLSWQIEAIDEGLKDEAAGRLVAHEQVMAKWRKRLEDQMGRGGTQ